MTHITTVFQEPSHWHLLSESDAQAYLELRTRFQEDQGKSRKGERLDSFTDRLEKARLFIDREPIDSWKRSLVCGVFFLGDALALNIQHLRILISKCKSSINGSLQQLGYSAPFPAHALEQQLLGRLPSNFRDSGELKKWTFRVKHCEEQSVPQTPFVVPLPLRYPPPPPPQHLNVESEAIQAQLTRKIPCPVKWRYKFWNIIHCSVSSQTDA
jgi:hypothetical protein